MAETKSTLIVNGTVIDPANSVNKKANVFIEDGKISFVGDDKPKADVQIDAEGLYVVPGLIDIHVHLREPGHEEEETIVTGSRAAVAGGFTSVAAMPNTHPVIDNEASVEFIVRRAHDADLCNIFPIGAITKDRAGKDLAEMGAMIRAGAVGFSDDGDGTANSSVTFRAMQYLTMFGKVMIQHCEDPALIGKGCMNAGETASKLGLPGRTGLAEEIMISRDLLLAKETKCKYHVAHVSTKNAVEMIRQAKASGLDFITAEVAPHHLALTDEVCETFDSNYKVAPPLRMQKDVDALKAGLADGTIDCLATDHAPHSREEKELEFLYAPCGIIGMETALPIYIKTLIDDKTLDWPTLISKMTINPAKVLGLDKGTLSKNADADITLIDPDKKWTIDKEKFYSKSQNCPFHGWDVHGRVIGTIVAGDIKHDDGLKKS